MFKIYFILISSLMLHSISLSTSGDYIIREEDKAWIILKINDDELYLARQFRYEEDSIFWGFLPQTGEILSTKMAEDLWNLYEEKHTYRLEQEAATQQKKKK